MTSLSVLTVHREEVYRSCAAVMLGEEMPSQRTRFGNVVRWSKLSRPTSQTNNSEDCEIVPLLTHLSLPAANQGSHQSHSRPPILLTTICGFRTIG